jgi:hypothetical protein
VNVGDIRYPRPTRLINTSSHVDKEQVHGTMRIFGRNIHSRMLVVPTCLLEASMRVTNGIPLWCSLLLLVGAGNRAQILKAT